MPGVFNRRVCRGAGDSAAGRRPCGYGEQQGVTWHSVCFCFNVRSTIVISEAVLVLVIVIENKQSDYEYDCEYDYDG